MVTRHHLAGVHTDPAGEGDAVVALQLLIEDLEGISHLRRGANRRRASSSWIAGTPNTAITASPMNFSTVPPWRSSAARISAK